MQREGDPNVIDIAMDVYHFKELASRLHFLITTEHFDTSFCLIVFLSLVYKSFQSFYQATLIVTILE
jgi:hypothetical protein